MRSAFPRVALFAGLAVTLSGCGKSSSPESVFAEFKDANEKKDMKRMMGCVTEDAQNQMAGMMAGAGVQIKNAGQMMPGGKAPADVQESITKVSAVLAKHGITDDLIKKNPMKLGDFKAPDAYLTAIQDKPQFIADVVDALPKNATTSPFSEVKSLKDLKIEGTKATAKMVRVTNGKEVEEPMEFESKNGVWKIKPNTSGLKGGGTTKG